MYIPNVLYVSASPISTPAGWLYQSFIIGRVTIFLYTLSDNLLSSNLRGKYSGPSILFRSMVSERKIKYHPSVCIFPRIEIIDLAYYRVSM